MIWVQRKFPTLNNHVKNFRNKFEFNYGKWNFVLKCTLLEDLLKEEESRKSRKNTLETNKNIVIDLEE